MRVVIQRVSKASVEVDKKVVGEIGLGLLIFAGFEELDNHDDFIWMANKIVNLRIFNDSSGVMNLPLQEVNGDVMVISQFTLHASTKKGNRPSYIKASKPKKALEQYNNFIFLLEKVLDKKIERGIFGADMKVSLLNDGPVTLCIDTKNKE